MCDLQYQNACFSIYRTDIFGADYCMILFWIITLNTLKRFWNRVLNGLKICEPNRTETKTEPNRWKNRKFTYKLHWKWKLWWMTLFLFRFSVRVSNILQMFRGIHISKVSVPFSSVLNSLQFRFRFDFRFRAFSNCCKNEIVYFNLVNEELWPNKLFQFFIGSRICEPNRKPNRTENRRKKPNRWEL